MMNKNIIISAAVALLVTVLTIGGFNYFQKKERSYPIHFQEELKPPVNNVLYTLDEDGKAVPLDFTSTARKVAPAVVQINVEITSRSMGRDRKSTRLNSSHVAISYAVFCLKKKKTIQHEKSAR